MLDASNYFRDQNLIWVKLGSRPYKRNLRNWGETGRNWNEIFKNKPEL